MFSSSFQIMFFNYLVYCTKIPVHQHVPHALTKIRKDIKSKTSGGNSGLVTHSDRNLYKSTRQERLSYIMYTLRNVHESVCLKQNNHFIRTGSQNPPVMTHRHKRNRCERGGWKWGEVITMSSQQIFQTQINSPTKYTNLTHLIRNSTKRGFCERI